MPTFGLYRQATTWLAVGSLLSGSALLAQDAATKDVKAPEDFKPYTQEISGTDVKFEMVPIPGGEFVMGSPDDSEGHQPEEGPTHPVKVSPFWMGKCEVTWEEYDIWSFNLDIQRRKLTEATATELDEVADAVTRPTKPYVDMTFGMGHDGYPAISMTQLAAKMYCRWLSEKTGHYYRLPTEAEWEYACRAGTTTPFSFGDASNIDEYAWYEDNSEFQYQPVGQKKPNPWGLHDMHGNVAEWCLDAYDPGFYATFEGKEADNPLNVPNVKEEYNRVVRGGSWDQSAEDLQSTASRVASTPDWKQQDPQRPQSIWYLTDALHVGFRVVRPVVVPTEETRLKLAMEPVPGEVTAEGLKEGFIDHEE